MITDTDKKVSQAVMRYVCQKYGVSKRELADKGKVQRIADIRKLAMLLMVYFRYEMSLGEIAAIFGRKHSNLVAHIGNHDVAMVADEEYREKFTQHYKNIEPEIESPHLPVMARLGDFTRQTHTKARLSMSVKDAKKKSVRRSISDGKVCQYRPLIIQGSTRCENCMFNRFGAAREGGGMAKKCVALANERLAYSKGQDDLLEFGEALNSHDKSKLVEMVEPIIATMQVQGTAVIDGLRRGARIVNSTYATERNTYEFEYESDNNGEEDEA